MLLLGSFFLLRASFSERNANLRSQNVIHRDIKASNIMVQPGDDGGYDWMFKRMSNPLRSNNVYKLADSGAASQLFYDYEEGFQSLVGTAESLVRRFCHPQIKQPHLVPGNVRVLAFSRIFKAEGETQTVCTT